MNKTAFWTFALMSLLLAPLASCGNSKTQAATPVSAEQPVDSGAITEQPVLEGKLIIFPAGSLTVPVESLTEAFQAKRPDVTFETEASGSNTAARKISEQRR